MKEKSLKLCVNSSQGCCPEVKRHRDGSITIHDDFGGKVLLTQEQALLIGGIVQQLLK